MPAMLSIMFDVLTDANLDSQQRVVEMLKESKVRRRRDCFHGLVVFPQIVFRVDVFFFLLRPTVGFLVVCPTGTRDWMRKLVDETRR